MLILNIQGEIMINNSPSSITNLELKNIKAVVFKAAEAYTNSDLKIDFDGFLNENEQITAAFLAAVGTKLFRNDNTKIEIPDEIVDDDLVDAYEDGAKNFYLKQELNKAKKVMAQIDRLTDKRRVVVDFSKYQEYDYATIAIVIMYLKTQGWHVNWEALNHNFSTIHEDWICRFEKGKKISTEELITPTIMKLSTQYDIFNKVQIWDNNFKPLTL